MAKRFTNEQINALKKYYPIGDWDSIFKYYPQSNKSSIKSLARRYGIKRDKSASLSNLDITGQKFEMLTAISYDHKKRNTVYWKCRCDCGNETIVPIYALIKGSTKSCGCLRHRPSVNSKDYTGTKFGMLTAVERFPQFKNYTTYYRCICDCGKNDVMVSINNLRNGHVVSCGNHRLNRAQFWKLKHPYDDDDRTYTVYRHISPTGKSYIGITKQNIERRFQNGNGYNTQPAFYRAIKKYGWNNFSHEILKTNLTEKEASEKEQYYIKEVYKSLAPKGYNTAEGGTTGSKNSKPIIQYFNGKPVNFFDTIAEASELLDIAQYTIRSHIGPENAVAGYYFEQLNPISKYDIPDEYNSLVDEEHYGLRNIIKEELHKTTVSRNLSMSKPVNKYDLDGHYICTFPSLAKAAESIGYSNGSCIYAAVNPKRQGDTAYGYLWKYDTGNHSDIKRHQYKAQKAVLQIDIKTNEIIKEYPSISKASKAVGTNNNQITDACKGKISDCKGYKWKFK